MRQGETCSIQFASPDASYGTNPMGLVMVLKDANCNARVLAANERLIIDALTCNLTSGGQYADVFAGAFTDTGAGNGSIQIVSFNEGYGFFEFPGEAMSLPIGTMPYTITGGAKQIIVTGVGRIVQDAPIAGQRPGWQTALTGAGIPPGGLPSLRAMAPDGLPDGSQQRVTTNSSYSALLNPTNSDPTPGSLNPPDNGGSI